MPAAKRVTKPKPQKPFPGGRALGLWWSDTSRTGYGIFGRMLAKGLLAAGVEVHPMPGNADATTMPRTAATVFAGWPSWSPGRLEGQHAAVYTMWEATRVPPAMIEALDTFDTVIVPNEFNREQFAAVHPNVVKVGQGVDPDVWFPLERTVEQTFNFLTCGLGARKGLDLVARAFAEAFPQPELLDPQPRLVMRTSDPFAGPHIERIPDRLPAADLVELHRRCHVYVQAARGEGWGLMPNQALATGMPTILSDIPGHAEYGWVPGAIRVPTHLVPAGLFMLGEAGQWWEPRVDLLVEAMRDAYYRYTYWCEEAAKGARLVAEQFTLHQMAAGVIAAVPLGDYTGSGTFQPRTTRRFRVVTTRDVQADIGDLRLDLRAGVEYWLPADAKRVLLDAGYLDPSCGFGIGADDATDAGRLDG